MRKALEGIASQWLSLASHFLFLLVALFIKASHYETNNKFTNLKST